MKTINPCHYLSALGAVVGIALLQGCSTIYSGSEAEDMRLRPMPGALEPEPVALEPHIVIPPATTFKVDTPIAIPTAAERPQLTTAYTVKEGDMLSSIAARYGLRWQDVAAVNPGLNPNRIVVGQTIQLPGKVDIAKPVRPSVSTTSKAVTPPAGANLYTVKSGDSLSVIAQRHGIKTAALKKANNLTSDKILAGQKLVIPGGKAAVAPEKPVVKPQAAETTAPVRPRPAETEVKAPTAPVALPTVVTPPAAPVAPPVAPIAPPTVPVVAPDAAVHMTSGTTISDTTTAPPPPPIPQLDAGTTAPATFQNHTVVAGEDLYSVAIRWSVSTAAIKAANNLTGSELIPGTVLKIPQNP